MPMTSAASACSYWLCVVALAVMDADLNIDMSDTKMYRYAVPCDDRSDADNKLAHAPRENEILTPDKRGDGPQNGPGAGPDEPRMATGPRRERNFAGDWFYKR